MPDRKIFTIVRRRTVVQVCSEQYSADTEAEALDFANDDQERSQAAAGTDFNGFSTPYSVNEWHSLSDVIEYPVLDADDILEVNDSITSSLINLYM